jgi:hypothetical protein
MTTGSRIYYNGQTDPKWRDDEIQERVKLPVDERLGGCRGFKSHRPHQSSIVGSARLSTIFFVFSLPLILILILVPNELRCFEKREVRRD